MSHRNRIVAALLAAALVVAGCGDDGGPTPVAGAAPDPAGATETTVSPDPAPAFPVTVSADNGEVTVGEEPAAIVSLSPSITEVLYAVGAGEQVVAVDTSSNFPPEAPTTELSGFRPNVEAIGALEPDLVFVARDRDDVVATLERVGLTVVLLEAAESLDDVYRQIETVATATGHAEAGAELAAAVEGEIDALLAGVPDRDEPLTYFLELTGDYHTLTSETFVGSLLGLAGFANVADGADPAAGGYPQLSAEYVLDADPDVIFVAHHDGAVPPIEEMAARPGWSDLTAIAEGQVVVLDPDIASRWGPRVVDLLSTVLEATAGIG